MNTAIFGSTDAPGTVGFRMDHLVRRIEQAAAARKHDVPQWLVHDRSTIQRVIEATDPRNVTYYPDGVEQERWHGKCVGLHFMDIAQLVPCCGFSTAIIRMLARRTMVERTNLCVILGCDPGMIAVYRDVLELNADPGRTPIQVLLLGWNDQQGESMLSLFGWETWPAWVRRCTEQNYLDAASHLFPQPVAA